MSTEDKNKWNNKYKNTPTLLEKREASKKLIELIKTCKKGRALDVACGAGRNSLYLAEQNFKVESIDISEVALENLKHKNITTKLVDLDEYTPLTNSYDLIVMTNFLDRKLILKLLDALKKDGTIFIETYMFHEENEKPPSNPNFLLKQGELKTFFDDNFKILDYDEFFNESYELYKMRKQSICAKKFI